MNPEIPQGHESHELVSIEESLENSSVLRQVKIISTEVESVTERKKIGVVLEAA